MIISKTPFRISFTGGGSDLPSYYRDSLIGGAVVSTAIDKYMYVSVSKKFDGGLRISYNKTENVVDKKYVKHTRVRSTLDFLNINGGIEIVSIADIPAKGTGLGSSSSFLVGLLNALYAYKSEFSTSEKLAKVSCYLEIDVLKEPIGKQDQYAAAYGGFNFIKFLPDDTVAVEPIICLKETILRLNKNLLVLFTGINRSASNILQNQNTNIKSKSKKVYMDNMVKLAYQTKEELSKNNLDNFAKILHENWILKKEMADNISNAQINDYYDLALKNGALGGKLLGAGGGGFLMFYAPFEKHDLIKAALPKLKPLEFNFERQGSQIIFVH